MPKQVIWSPQSEQDLVLILDYLQANWSNSVSLRFIDVIDELIQQISLHPKQFPVIHRKLKVRKCVITQYNTMYYSVSHDKIYILRIYDNRQDPKKLKF